MKPARFDGIAEVILQAGPQTRRAQEIACSEPGCSCKLKLPINNDRKPPDVVFNIAKRKGWDINAGKRVFRCPDHGRKHS